MPKVLVIGDTHGKLTLDMIFQLQVTALKESHEYVIQVGDLGNESDWEQASKLGLLVVAGNHEPYPLLPNYSAYLGNYGKIPNLEGFYFIRGAKSIFQETLTPGYNFWPGQEELNVFQQRECYEEYIKVRPRVVISHEAPQSVRSSLFGIEDRSSTSNFLDDLLYYHQPDLWIFGHHHKSRRATMGNTQYICLGIAEMVSITIHPKELTLTTPTYQPQKKKNHVI